jgi:hypothetical protein
MYAKESFQFVHRLDFKHRNKQFIARSVNNNNNNHIIAILNFFSFFFFMV